MIITSSSSFISFNAVSDTSIDSKKLKNESSFIYFSTDFIYPVY